MDDVKETTKPLKGVLYFYNDVDMDCGIWAFNDETFNTPNPHFSCTKCHIGWDKTRESEEDVLKKASMTTRGTPRKRLCDHNFTQTTPIYWSYHGLHIIDNGDLLTIYDKTDPTKEVWSGTVRLRKYKSIRYSLKGLMPIISKQKGVKRRQWTDWFMEKYPAELTPAPHKKK